MDEWEAYYAQRGGYQQQSHRNWLFPSEPSCDDGVCGVGTPRSRQHALALVRNRDGKHVPEDYDKYLELVKNINVGDFTCYDFHKPDGDGLAERNIRVVLFKMPRNEMTWPKGEEFPKPYVVACLAGAWTGGPPHACWVRYENCTDMRRLTEGELNKYVNNNVQLQNYIEQVKDAIKAGTCIIN